MNLKRYLIYIGILSIEKFVCLHLIPCNMGSAITSYIFLLYHSPCYQFLFFLCNIHFFTCLKQRNQYLYVLTDLYNSSPMYSFSIKTLLCHRSRSFQHSPVTASSVLFCLTRLIGNVSAPEH